jgi:hypothetical protein
MRAKQLTALAKVWAVFFCPDLISVLGKTERVNLRSKGQCYQLSSCVILGSRRRHGWRVLPKYRLSALVQAGADFFACGEECGMLLAQIGKWPK